MAITTEATAPTSTKKDWKADRFLNISVPRADGTQAKLCFAALSSQDPDHKDIIEALDANEEVNLEMLRAALVFTYNSGEKNSTGVAGIFKKVA